MTVTTTQRPASAEGCESGRRSFEAFLLEGERHMIAEGIDESAGFAEFFRAVPADLRTMIAGYFHRQSWLSDLQRQGISTVGVRIAGDASAASQEDCTGHPDSVVRQSKSMPIDRVGSIDLFLEELAIDPTSEGPIGHSRSSVFLDVTTVDARGEVATTGNRVCRRKDCTPAAFCDRVLATIDIDRADEDWPRTISFEVDALEGVDDRLPEVIGAARGYLRNELAGMLADRGGRVSLGGVMALDVADHVDSHVRAWLDCFISWFTDLLPSSPREAGAVALGSAQFTATLGGPELSYAYRNGHTGRLIEISGHSLVRSRPEVHTFGASGGELKARFRLGLRGSGTLKEPPAADIGSQVLEAVGMGQRR
ncbi:hypothetical protein G3T36_10695 [Diaminobutyricibacter tongyongensis]|uniref:Uncharacterized protein n=1 Tax=Leifsonia tongyongensis TaxID=1268043 RepID=A0A6L9XY37_9MICO|nr:hypothetical protein [Diaminobutyricibacter tongyongensis]NEN06341.1 hypothetical protein [Diaminobutyricibacter tongyongensis]